MIFLRRLPKGHPRQGEKTFFVEQLLNALNVSYFLDKSYYELLLHINKDSIANGKLSEKDIFNFWHSLEGTIEDKKHTIRKGQSKKITGPLSFRVWSGRPYHSPQIIFHPSVSVKACANFEIDQRGWLFHNWYLDDKSKRKLAQNDGLSYQDMSCLLYTSPSPRDGATSRMPSSA